MVQAGGSARSSGAGSTSSATSFADLSGQSYRAVLYKIANGRFYMDFPQLPYGQAQGETVDEALQDAKEVLTEMLAVSFDIGCAVPLPSLDSAQAEFEQQSIEEGAVVLANMGWYDVEVVPE